MLRVYTQRPQGERWLQRYRGCTPVFACILGFTETALIPGISAAGKTPQDRRFTAIADAEFLVNGPCPHVQYPLPPLARGASPVFISRAVLSNQKISQWVFNAGLPTPPAVAYVDLEGQAARCLSTGAALPLEIVKKLWHQGLNWGQKLANPGSYVIFSECVVGGTTTALAILAGLGIPALGKINSSHPVCNHDQKQRLVKRGILACGAKVPVDPFTLVAAVGDPMQIVVAGMLLAASQSCGVLLAGGTQMIAVYALARKIALSHPRQKDQSLVPDSLNIFSSQSLSWFPENIVVGTTRWVAEDPTGDTVGLANLVGTVPLLASQINFSNSKYPQLQAYERGYVKEGVGAGGCAIAAHLYQNWQPADLLKATETLIAQQLSVQDIAT